MALPLGFEIRPARERGLDLNKDLAWSCYRNGRIYQAQIPGSVIHHRSHRCVSTRAHARNRARTRMSVLRS